MEFSDRLVLTAIGTVFHLLLEGSGHNILGVRFDEVDTPMLTRIGHSDKLRQTLEDFF